MATVAARCEKVYIELQNMSDDKMSKEEYKVVSAITYTKEAMGGCYHGFCSWIIEDTSWV